MLLHGRRLIKVPHLGAVGGGCGHVLLAVEGVNARHVGGGVGVCGGACVVRRLVDVLAVNVNCVGDEG